MKINAANCTLDNSMTVKATLINKNQDLAAIEKAYKKLAINNTKKLSQAA